MADRKLGAYFMPYEESKIPYKYGELNEDGVPVFDPSTIKQEGDLSYHPISIVQYGLAHFNRWLETEDADSKQAFLTCAQFLANSYTENLITKHALWWYNFPLRFPSREEAWISGMAQGQILSLLVRAYELSQDEQYLSVAEKAYCSLTLDLEQDGCLSRDKYGPFIQELAFKPHTTILNGALYAFIGIIEYARIQPGLRQDILDLSSGIEARLKSFDTGYWSKYSQQIRFNLADLHYHKVHIRQLEFVGEALDNAVFKATAQKFTGYLDRYSKLALRLRFLSLSMNRLFRVLGLERLLYKSIPQ